MYINDNYEVGYLDVSNLSLSELIKLREKLNGSTVNSICTIDAIIKQNVGTYYDDNQIKYEKRTKQKAKYPIKKNRKYLKKKYC